MFFVPKMLKNPGGSHASVRYFFGMTCFSTVCTRYGIFAIPGFLLWADDGAGRAGKGGENLHRDMIVPGKFHAAVMEHLSASLN